MLLKAIECGLHCQLQICEIVHVYIRAVGGWIMPTPECETNCETFVHVDTESVTHKMAVLLQIDWSVVHTK